MGESMKILFVLTLNFAVYFDETHDSIESAVESLNNKYSSLKSMFRIYKTTEDLLNTFWDKYNKDMSDDEYHELFDNTFTAVD